VEYVKEQYFEESPGEEPPKEQKPGKTSASRAQQETAELPVEQMDKKFKPKFPIRRAKESAHKTAPVTLKDHLDAVRGHHIARFLSSDLVIVKEIKTEDLDRVLDELNGDVAGVVTDDAVTQKLLDHMVGKGLEYVAAREFKGIIKRPLTIRLMKIA
jgi:DNA primase